MDLDVIKQDVKDQLTEHRFAHTLRVMDTAVDLSKRYNESIPNAKLAAIFHDYAKYFDQTIMRQIIVETDLPNDLLDYHHELWHGPVASHIIKEKYGVQTSDVRNAIKYHTTGRACMSQLEKIIFLADYIEPGRQFPGVEEVREVAYEDLTKACWMAAKNTTMYLISKNNTIYPDSIHAYNDLRNQINGGI
ncbi:bis(5'-nucleosyl)-tetraphosphatase (symmetrical) YqeK [Oceanobacillus kimchii]|uniref:bis(5'-nucleosyl)-tetraphosphatase (symmetrical) n=1 Tax=Oceanobacillus kimchii TaxID=746691 RepID=A0ABQ5TPV6_9BACI|nr:MULTISPECIES: bis(5'-nucleosyl)-tetraphosphatase (symmetrical) YqeK [Oceanobacillus]MCT1575840.1 bis(5'-nucleosyl)-tetraphosphatase (symmetrical) YqeK [Oceanobacillus kimchii]MCT2135477.1 bis(5'-nucleosyl)-tetraphosphatase (symmetrical) YqeK [Oceanobacillus kimchii]OEH55584.1 phosphohydrolase [Oceanobacillus sp. E9]GLO66642.1 hypothetical protein MACH08_24260 [Oceanobacillus kimchii]